jgi:hypothetical protein
MLSTVDESLDRSVATEALTWPDRARAAVVRDAASYEDAAQLLLGIKDLRRKIAETFDPHCKRAYEAHRALTKEKADAEAPLTQAERIIKDSLRAYDAEQERLRREQQRIADEQARREAEDRALEQAAALEREGKDFGDEALVAEAHALINAPIVAPTAAPVAKSTPKVAGITMRKTWNFRVVNEALVPRQYLSVNETKIRGVVRALGAAAAIPGVEVYEETSVAAGRR